MRARYNFARRPFRNDRPAYVIAGALLLIGATLLVVNLRLFSDYRRQVADTRAEIAALETRGRNAEEKAQAARGALGSYRLSALAEESRGLARILAERRFSWTTLLSRLEKTLPPEVGLVHLQPQFDPAGEASLDLQLVARNREAIVRTIEALSKNSAFGHVALKSESQPEQAAGEPLQFSISSRYDPGETR
jgi:Tfp pilus assembly protein PilN